jgi:transposase
MNASLDKALVLDNVNGTHTYTGTYNKIPVDILNIDTNKQDTQTCLCLLCSLPVLSNGVRVVHFVLSCVCMYLVPCCDIRYDIKWCSVRLYGTPSLPPVLVPCCDIRYDIKRCSVHLYGTPSLPPVLVPCCDIRYDIKRRSVRLKRCSVHLYGTPSLPPVISIVCVCLVVCCVLFVFVLCLLCQLLLVSLDCSFLIGP